MNINPSDAEHPDSRSVLEVVEAEPSTDSAWNMVQAKQVNEPKQTNVMEARRGELHRRRT
jgi:hypothetical protein